MTWRQVLESAGVAVGVGQTPYTVLIDAVTEQRERFLLWDLGKGIPPSRLKPPPADEPGLIVVDRTTPAFRRRATEQGWSYVSGDGAARIMLSGRTIMQGPASAEVEASAPQVRRKAGVWAMARCLAPWLASGRRSVDLTQQTWAALTGMSQPSVYRALKHLAHDGVALDDPTEGLSTLLSWWSSHYRGASGSTSYWFALTSPGEQAVLLRDAVTQARTETSPGVEVALTGDVAADVVAPWQRPESLKAYLSRDVPLERHGFIPVADPSDATMTIVVPHDRGVFSPHPWIGGRNELPIADPLEVWHDLASGTGPTASEAAGVFRDALLAHSDRWLRTRGLDRVSPR